MVKYKEKYKLLLKENELLQIKIHNLNNLINKLEIKNCKLTNKKGSLCSFNGKQYELEIYNNKMFNTQKKTELG